MPRLIPTVSIGVSREKGGRHQTVYPAIGEMFDFTDEEIEQIRAEHPEGLRKPINETVDKPAKGSKSKEVTSKDEEMTVKETEGEDVPQSGSSRRGAPPQRKPGVRHVSGDDDEEL